MTANKTNYHRMLPIADLFESCDQVAVFQSQRITLTFVQLWHKAFEVETKQNTL